MTAKLTIDVWADVVCPWCYLGEHRLGRAIGASKRPEDVELRVHTFQLDPAATSEVRSTTDYLASKYGMPIDRASEMERGMAERAAADGLPYAVDRPVSSTFDMLRLVHLAGEHGKAWEYLRALQDALFGGDPDAFEPATLVRIATELGIPQAGAEDVLATDRFAVAVRADHQAAIALGATGVPFTVLDQRLGIPGAVSVEQYAAAIDQAWAQADA